MSVSSCVQFCFTQPSAHFFTMPTSKRPPAPSIWLRRSLRRKVKYLIGLDTRVCVCACAHLFLHCVLYRTDASTPSAYTLHPTTFGAHMDHSPLDLPRGLGCASCYRPKRAWSSRTANTRPPTTRCFVGEKIRWCQKFWDGVCGTYCTPTVHSAYWTPCTPRAVPPLCRCGVHRWVTGNGANQRMLCAVPASRWPELQQTARHGRRIPHATPLQPPTPTTSHGRTVSVHRHAVRAGVDARRRVCLQSTAADCHGDLPAARARTHCMRCVRDRWRCCCGTGFPSRGSSTALDTQRITRTIRGGGSPWQQATILRRAVSVAHRPPETAAV